MGRKPRIDSFFSDEARLTFVDDAEALFETNTRRLLTDNVMRQAVQRTDAIFVQSLEGILEKAFDTRLKVVHRRVDQRDDEDFLSATDPAFVNDLSRQRREDVSLSRAGDRGNAEASAAIFENFLLGITRSKVVNTHNV